MRRKASASCNHASDDSTVASKSLDRRPARSIQLNVLSTTHLDRPAWLRHGLRLYATRPVNQFQVWLLATTWINSLQVCQLEDVDITNKSQSSAGLNRTNWISFENRLRLSRSDYASHHQDLASDLRATSGAPRARPEGSYRRACERQSKNDLAVRNHTPAPRR
jgi:hypothetical protein